jgi:hypothetical protein
MMAEAFEVLCYVFNCNFHDHVYQTRLSPDDLRLIATARPSVMQIQE